jgi:hypothetical protein
MAKKSTPAFPAQPRKSRRHRGWLIAAAIVGILLIAIYAGLYYFLNPKYLEARISAAVAAATDSLYHVEIGDTEFSLLRRLVGVTEIKLETDTLALSRKFPAGYAPRLQYQITVPALHFVGIHLWPLLVNREVRLHTLRIENPRIQLRSAESTGAHKDNDEPSNGDSPEAFKMRLAKRLPDIAVAQIQLDSAAFSWESGSGKHNRELTVESIFAEFNDVEIDSVAALKSDRVFFSDEIRLRVAGVRYSSAESLYLLEIGQIRASTKSSVLEVDSLLWGPTLSDSTFMNTMRFRSSRYKTRVPQILFQGIDYGSLIDSEILIASVTLEQPQLDVYLDRKLPSQPWQVARLPHQAFQSIPTQVRIDSIFVNGGDIRYAERPDKGIRTGRIRFAEVSGSVTNLTNDPRRMSLSTPAVVEASAMLAGTGRLQARIEYPLLSEKLNLSYRGKLESMDMRVFNDVLVDLDGTRIESGRIDSISFAVNVRDNAAHGSMMMLYRNLKVEKLNKPGGHREKKKTLLSWLANSAIDNENLNKPDSPAKVAEIHLLRTKSSSIFKFIWQTLRQGVYSTLGL